jgi:protein required for attachment to host cells
MQTWILVAAAGRARLFERQADHGALAQIGGYTKPEARIIAAASERRSVSQDSASSAGRAPELHTDSQDQPAIGFAKGLAEMLEQGRVEQAYTRLLLVAPPRFLGRLRAELGVQLGKLVAGSIAKNLSHATTEEIRAALNAL